MIIRSIDTTDTILSKVSINTTVPQYHHVIYKNGTFHKHPTKTSICLILSSRSVTTNKKSTNGIDWYHIDTLLQILSIVETH